MASQGKLKRNRSEDNDNRNNNIKRSKPKTKRKVDDVDLNDEEEEAEDSGKQVRPAKKRKNLSKVLKIQQTSKVKAGVSKESLEEGRVCCVDRVSGAITEGDLIEASGCLTATLSHLTLSFAYLSFDSVEEAKACLLQGFLNIGGRDCKLEPDNTGKQNVLIVRKLLSDVTQQELMKVSGCTSTVIIRNHFVKSRRYRGYLEFDTAEAAETLVRKKELFVKDKSLPVSILTDQLSDDQE